MTPWIVVSRVAMSKGAKPSSTPAMVPRAALQPLRADRWVVAQNVVPLTAVRSG
jgi:hypothetical protein